MFSEKIDQLIKESMIAKNHPRTEVLRAIKNAFLVHKTAKNAQPLDIVTEIAILKRMLKQRNESATQYQLAGRMDLYNIESKEADIIKEFIPEAPTDQALTLRLAEICASQGCEDGPKIPKSKMGVIIKELKAMFPTADGKQIADMVKSCVV